MTFHVTYEPNCFFFVRPLSHKVYATTYKTAPACFGDAVHVTLDVFDVAQQGIGVDGGLRVPFNAEMVLALGPSMVWLQTCARGSDMRFVPPASSALCLFVQPLVAPDLPDVHARPHHVLSIRLVWNSVWNGLDFF
ncbi:hypothetical protein SPRG_11124 [Saprolegnia parasitica CBS 223.65]|uniref:Uncharacterized protein n=1 Tax=Saprolegnia parasitica (strain CBS 223.65) TaxID=695850 RepID=A0A067CB01_SAPPC|nr:hypothetical protein SPRG_11124 [Saprolegnia parasitica CBS 223.65]KDO23676.1 hypothetical protein SPRG_11124 [Saprolegnia parasitica CBS 223.65]|eukprot:XP_012205659.1 hypothetical protein SPRG_11124 [Saprolegnia parasitica CBS 223.65]